jgi:hypothetical protein
MGGQNHRIAVAYQPADIVSGHTKGCSTMEFPGDKAPATLHVKSKRSSRTALMRGPFGDCAWVLSSILPHANGDMVWVESVTGRLDAAAVKRAFDTGVIKRVNLPA